MRSTRVWVAFGGNLGDAPAAMHAAAASLGRVPGVSPAGVSRLWRSPALYAPGDTEPQPDYANAVAGFDVMARGERRGSGENAGSPDGDAADHKDPGWTPETFLATLQAHENAAGRDRDRPRWRARPLDLDLLWWDGVERHTPALVLPHPEAARRAFVVVPWAELAPDLRLAGERLAVHAARLDAHGMTRWRGTPWDTLSS